MRTYAYIYIYIYIYIERDREREADIPKTNYFIGKLNKQKKKSFIEFS